MKTKNELQWLSVYEKTAIILLALFYLVGLIGHSLPQFHSLMLNLTPYVLLVTATVGLFPFIVEKKRKLLLWVAITFAATLFLEILGVATGLVFGSYTYGATLGFKFLGAPVLIGINWTLVILGALVIATRITRRIIHVAIITALICVLFDYIMEPVAIALDYWSWEDDIIPLHNYLAWGVIAFVFAGLFQWWQLKSNHLLPLAILIIQTIFFLSLRLIVT